MSGQDKQPTPADNARDEQMIRDMQRFGRPSPKAQQEAERLKHGKKAGGKK
jgi:hypothetical protein